MACKFCSLKILDRVVLHVDVDTECCNSYLPNMEIHAIYHGKAGVEHQFRSTRPIVCPDCGHSMFHVYAECPDEGILIELPVVIELPVEVIRLAAEKITGKGY